MVEGMCGGPVTSESVVNGKSVVKVVGMLEGIVPMTHPVKELQGLAAFIHADEIALLLAKIEAGSEDIVKLEGGQALGIVAENEDPANLDLNNIEKRVEEYEKKYGKPPTNQLGDRSKKPRGVPGDYYQ